MSGQTNSFHRHMNVKMTRTATSGLDSGSTMLRKVRTWLAPSMRAASSSSSGMPRKNCRAMNSPKASASRGSTTPHVLLSRSRSMTSWNCGIMITCTGTMSVLRMSRNSRSRPGKRSLAKA